MDQKHKSLDEKLEHSLGKLEAAEGPAVSRAIREIVSKNRESCRLHKFLEDGETADDYVQRVLEHYREWHDYVHQLKVARDQEPWERFLRDKLQPWAYNTLCKKGFPQQGNRRHHAKDCATDAAMAILRSRFPFDVHFERWAHVLTQYVCLQYIDRHWRPAAVFQDQMVSLDEYDGWLQNLAHPSAEDETEKLSLHHDLQQAVDQLSTETRREFIRLYYFQQYSFDEITDEINKNKNALYKLHFDALENLREIWGGDSKV